MGMNTRSRFLATPKAKLINDHYFVRERPESLRNEGEVVARLNE
jgi:hypothetical protein